MHDNRTTNGLPTKANVVALVSPIQWHHDPTNFMFKFNYHQV